MSSPYQRKRKPEDAPAVAHQPVGMPDAGKKARTDFHRPGDWDCPSCAFHNFASRAQCQRCHVPKPVAAPLAPVYQSAYQPAPSYVPQNQYNQYPPPTTPAPVPLEPLSTEYYESGYQSYAPQPAPAFPPHIAAMLAALSPAERDAFYASGAASALAGIYQQRELPPALPVALPVALPTTALAPWVAAPAVLPPNFRPGDWMCAQCNGHNYASRTTCRRCEALKPEGWTGPSSDYKTTDFRPGDWNCPSCQAHNFAARTDCRKCSAPRGPAAPGEEKKAVHHNFRPGDWLCPDCNEHNYASRTTCRKCGANQGEDSVQKMKEMLDKGVVPKAAPSGGKHPDDWVCPHCNNLNFSYNRISCRQCQAPKPGLEPASAAPGEYGAY